MVAAGMARIFSDLGYSENCTPVSSLEDAVRISQVQKFDLFMLDINLPDGNGADIVELLKANNHLAKIIVVSGDINPSIIARLKKLGVDGVYDKRDSSQELVELLGRVMAGGGQELSSTARLIEVKAQDYALSKRQQEVLFFLNEGLSSKEISYRMNLSQAIVSSQIAELTKKLGCNSSGQISPTARRLGIIETARQENGTNTAPRIEPMRKIPTAERIAEYFTLTRAEASLCEGLVSGLSLKETAKHQHKSEATVRTYLKQVYQKTGFNGQGQLVSGILLALID
jgi:DNA-binding NarL/FixJ family response regulator